MMKTKKEIRERIEARSRGETVGKKPRNLILFFGPSAVGKTTLAEEYAVEKYDEVAFEKNGKEKWWDTYAGESVVLCDEWRKEMTGDMPTFNNMTNAGPYSGEIKGGTVLVVAKEMLFTTNRHPMDIFGTKWSDPCYRAVARRFAEVRWWNDELTLTVLKNPGPPDDTVEWSDANHEWKRFWEWKNETNAGDAWSGIEGYFTLQ
jgi:DNA polymerase III delta prime subunit